VFNTESAPEKVMSIQDYNSRQCKTRIHCSDSSVKLRSKLSFLFLTQMTFPQRLHHTKNHLKLHKARTIIFCRQAKYNGQMPIISQTDNVSIAARSYLVAAWQQSHNNDGCDRKWQPSWNSHVTSCGTAPKLVKVLSWYYNTCTSQQPLRYQHDYHLTHRRI